MERKIQKNQLEEIKVEPKDYETKSLNIQKNTSGNNEKNLTKYIKEFCKNTKIYGFSYLVEPKRSKVEKCFWLIFILISFGISIHLLKGLWDNKSENPTVILRQSPKPIWQVPFPAITICPETKVRQSVYNFTYHYHQVVNYLSNGGNETHVNLQKFSDMSLVCDNHLYTEGHRTTNFEVTERLKAVAPSLQETLFGCKWTSLNDSCESLFTPILTEDGLCFTFNMLSKKEIFNNHFQDDFDDYYYDGQYSEGWSLENGYEEHIDVNSFPRRTTTSGTRGGLFILLKTDEKDFDYVCRGPVQGFKVLLHQPSEVPRISNNYFRAPLNQEVIVHVKPNLVTSVPDLRKYDIDERQCIFSAEKSLKFFRNYTQENCRIECLTNYTLHKCNCVAFHMPREFSIPICGSGSNTCMFEAEQELLKKYVKSDTCGCLPACTSLTYDAEITQADFNWPKVMQAFESDVDEFPGIHMSRIVVFFDNLQFDASLRTKIHKDYTEFLAHCGGILMLFTGFSFLAIAEILYFFTLRLICNVKKYGQVYKVL